MLETNKNYTKFPNEILERATASKFRLLEIKIIHVIVRQTYGYHRREVAISLRTFEKKMNVDHRNIHPVIKRLADAKIIFQRTGPKMKFGKTVHMYSINEESFHRWNTRIGIKKITETGINNIPIKERKKDLKKDITQLVDKFDMNK